MNLIIDSREHKLIEILQKHEIPFIQQQLEIGDIQVRNKENNDTIMVIERKTYSDLYSSIQDGRHREQKARLLAHYEPQQICYLLEGTMKCIDSRKKIINGAQLNSLFRDKIKILYSTSPQDSISIILALVKKCETYPQWFVQNTTTQETSNEQNNNYVNTIKLKKKDNITPQICQILYLAQIPGVSQSIAMIILHHYKTIRNLINYYENNCNDEKERVTMLQTMELTTSSGKIRKLGPTLSKRIYEYVMCKEEEEE